MVRRELTTHHTVSFMPWEGVYGNVVVLIRQKPQLEFNLGIPLARAYRCIRRRPMR